MQVAELAPGLWRWTARHPEWTPDQGGPEGWEPEVASYYCETGEDVLVLDPIVPDEGDERDRFWRALDRDVVRAGALHVVLTCAWHARSSAELVSRYGARLWVPEATVRGLPAGVAASDPFRPGDALPGAGAAIAGAVGGGDAPDVLVWLPSHAGLVAGDTLLGGGGGIRMCPDSWLGDADPIAERASLRQRLAGVPVERVLPTHGEPVVAGARDALEQALA